MRLRALDDTLTYTSAALPRGGQGVVQTDRVNRQKTGRKEAKTAKESLGDALSSSFLWRFIQPGR